MSLLSRAETVLTGLLGRRRSPPALQPVTPSAPIVGPIPDHHVAMRWAALIGHGLPGLADTYIAQQTADAADRGARALEARRRTALRLLGGQTDAGPSQPSPIGGSGDLVQDPGLARPSAGLAERIRQALMAGLDPEDIRAYLSGVEEDAAGRRP